MSRDAARKLGRSPNGDFVLVKRNNTGTVQMTTDTSTTASSVSSTAVTTLTTKTLTGPNLVFFDSATMTIAAAQLTAMAQTPVQLTISRDGSAVASTTHSATTKASTSITGTAKTHYTPLNAPTYKFKYKQAAGNALDVKSTLKREERVV